MTFQQTSQLMRYLLILSAFSILIGVLFKLQHYPYGQQLFYFGLVANFVISSLEINRLKRRIKTLEKGPETSEDPASLRK